MLPELAERLQREVSHGETDTSARQAEHGWDSAAGQIRKIRRGDFLVSGLPAAARVLEVGAGTGMHTATLLKAFKDVEAIDISQNLLSYANTAAPGANYHVMDAHHPQYPDESFDAIVGVSILHHLDWDIALKSYFRLLKPAGVVRFSEPNLLNPQIYLQKNIGFLKRMAGDSADEYAFTRWRIAKSLENAGFVGVSVRPFEFLHPATPARLIPFLVRVESVVSKTPLNEIAGSLLIAARKP
jgi:ubiquinone/menaquinone biosynthesis C-methylase UbiE